MITAKDSLYISRRGMYIKMRLCLGRGMRDGTNCVVLIASWVVSIWTWDTCTSYSISAYIRLTSRISRDDGQERPPGYGLNLENYPGFIRNYRSLARLTYLWPPVDQASTLGSKWQLIENLDIIAAQGQTVRPQSTLLESGDPLDDQLVLKRTHSESGNHVLLPGSHRVARTWRYLNKQSEIPRCRWFSQTNVPLLKTLGEWRVVMVGGAPAYTVHTQPTTTKLWKHRPANSFWPLDRLRYVSRLIT